MFDRRLGVIAARTDSYIGHGKSDMDKFSHSNQAVYIFGNRTIVVERNYIGKETICEIMKKHMQECMTCKAKLGVLSDKQYNNSSNDAGVITPNGGGK